MFNSPLPLPSTSGAFLSDNLASLVVACAGPCAQDDVRTDAPVCCDDQVEPTVCNSHVCVKLCSLILAQLVEAHAEVMRRLVSKLDIIK